MPFDVTLLTLYPEMFPGFLGHALPGKALSEGLWSCEAISIREHSTHKHASVDDTPFGGGAGMVMRPDVVDAAIDASTKRPGPLVFLTPTGPPLTQSIAEELAAEPGLRLLCGRFEGIDQRVIDKHAPREISIGDYVLSGGETAAFVLLDAVLRLLPGVLGNADSPRFESFQDELLEHPQYTRPAVWTDSGGTARATPPVLLSGNHAAIAAWRQDQAKQRTQERRPDLYERFRRNQRNLKD